MTQSDPTPSLEDVLGAFAVEPDHSKATLERYLREYPQYAEDLIDLSSEIAQHVDVSTAPLSADDEARIEAAWRKHIAPAPVASDPMASLNAAEQRTIAQKLGVPRNVFSAFRDRRVVVASVPRIFLARLAALLGTPLDEFQNMLARAPSLDVARSYKSDQKPQAQSQVTFEQLLTESGLSPEERAALLTDKT